MTTEQQTALLQAAEQVLWKLSHYHRTPDYSGPGRITRQDATVIMLQAAVDSIREVAS